MTTYPVELGEVQETLLGTLYARALETRKKRGLISDDKALEIVNSIDYDFSKFDDSPMLFGSVLRTLVLDQWVRDFLTLHPAGTVIEIGAGLNTRFERVDNGRLHWVDLDLPDAMALRRNFFKESSRHRMIAGSVLDGYWVSVVRELPGPYFFVIEGVLLYLDETEVRRVLQRLTENFPGAGLAFDTAAARFVAYQDHPDLKKRLQARLVWACDEPKDLERWSPDLRLHESRTLLQIPKGPRSRLPLTHRAVLPALRLIYRRRASSYLLNRFVIGETDPPRSASPSAPGVPPLPIRQPKHGPPMVRQVTGQRPDRATRPKDS